MTNIPTELLRTLIAVVDLRSFTKAAQSLGITQPAVSAQIKRLQYLLGTDLLDKSAPGVTLTSTGELVVNYARRLLAINDQILDFAAPRPSKQILRIGMGGDFAIAPVSAAAARFRETHDEVSFSIRTGTLDTMMRDLREGEIDILIGLSNAGVVRDARHFWIEPLVWVGSPVLRADREQPIPLATYGEDCILHRVAVGALNEIHRAHVLVYVGPSILGIVSATGGGIGFSVVPRNRAGDFPSLVIREDEALPRLPAINCGVYLREGAGSDLREQFADLVADILAPSRASPRSAA
ncbi:MAG TPA: LysR family transcriptional regulator [Pseudorhodoplanes sp.]|jgi:DNA-binding transcriptional LysR family regulator|nr:LysR family transcriptional regulator [Pseudorhodoplanes sp.]